MQKLCNRSVQIGDFFPDFSCLPRIFWEVKKSGLKTEIESERHENKKLKFGLEERKSLNYAKNEIFALNFVWNVPKETNFLDQFS